MRGAVDWWRRHPIRNAAVTGLVAVLAVAVGWLGVVLGGPLPTPSVTIALPALPAAAPADPALPSRGAAAIGLLDGPVLASAQPDAQLPIASITKVITVLAALDALPLDADEPGPTHVLDATDHGYDGAAKVAGLFRLAVPEGTELTERQLVEATLIASSASHMLVLARWAFGSIEAEPAAANAWLAAHGLTGTHVVDSTGLSPEDVSTAADLLRLGALALADPVVAAVVQETSVDIPGVEAPVTANNPLLGEDGVIGIKTGNTTQAGNCLLFAARVPIGGQEVTIVGVVLGQATWNAMATASKALLESTVAGLHEARLVAGTPFGTYTTPWGTSAQAVLAQDLAVLAWGDEAVTPTSELDPDGGLTAGEAAGSVRLTSSLGSADVPLVADAALGRPGSGWRLANAFR